MTETTGSAEISDTTKIDLKLVITIAVGIFALVAQWGNMKLELAALDSKHAAAEAALEAKFNAELAALDARHMGQLANIESKQATEKSKASGDHKLLCAIAAKLNVIGGDCP